MGMMSLHTLIGGLVEVFGADLFIVVGLAGQKIAVMKIIERNRLESANVDHIGRTDSFGMDSLETSLMEETSSEVMTVQSEVSMLGDEVINDTQVPEGCELIGSAAWIVSLIIFIIGNVLELLALGLASQTDVSLLSNFTLLWNAVVSRLIFKEEFNMRPVFSGLRIFRHWDAFHCFILILGSMVAVFFTPEVPENDLDSKELLHRWTAPPYRYWGGFMVVAMFVTSLILVKNWRNLKTGNLNAALIAGLCGFMSAFCITLSKVSTTLISNTMKGSNEFSNPEAVFLVSLWGVALISQLALLNVGLGAFEQGVVVPIYEVVGTIAAIVSGILFYRTYNDFDLTDWIGFGAGVLLMTWGVWLVAHREVHTQQELSDQLHSNLSAVDDLLRITAFSRLVSSEGYVPYQDSAALDAGEEGGLGFESTYTVPLDQTTRRLYADSEARSESNNNHDTYEYRSFNLSDHVLQHDNTVSAAASPMTSERKTKKTRSSTRKKR